MIYFVSPSIGSIQQISNDFMEERPREVNEAGEDISVQGCLYDFVHLIFCSEVPKFKLKPIISNKNLTDALLSMR